MKHRLPTTKSAKARSADSPTESSASADDSVGSSTPSSPVNQPNSASSGDGLLSDPTPNGGPSLSDRIREASASLTKGSSPTPPPLPTPAPSVDLATQQSAPAEPAKESAPAQEKKSTGPQPETIANPSVTGSEPIETKSEESDKSKTEKPKAVEVVSETDPAAKASTPSNGHAPFLIQTRGLVKQYGGRRVVNGVDIHVKAGEVVGLLGKNGAGKTTTFYMIVGLVPPNEGHVFMGSEDVTRMPMYRRARRGIGYLPQEESIFRKLTVEENLLAILEMLPLTEDERDARCDELLKDFGLEHVRESVAITLSGGEKRRVTIARALVTSPSLLLLDEPFAGVDPMAVHDIQEIILKLKEKGMGVLLTDHSVRETLSVVDRAYIIDEGRVLSEGSKEFLLNDPVAREIYLGHRFSM